MIKYFISVALLLAAASSTAQQNKPDSTFSLTAINAEKMLEKMGFENLVNTVFENKGSGQPVSAEKAARRAAMRKSLAAIYGAGINFNKKIWYSTTQKIPSGVNRFSPYAYKDVETALRLLLIPVANRQVMEEHVIKLLQAAAGEKDSFAFTQKNGLAYLQKKGTCLLLTNTEMLLVVLPKKIIDYNEDIYNGRLIKSDTTVTHREPAETIEAVDKPADLVEIDKLLPNGKIKRLYTYKEVDTKKLRFTPPKIVKDEAVQEEMKEEVVADTVAVAAPVEDSAVTMAPVLPDTSTRVEYLNDSTFITRYYLSQTEAEREAATTKYEEEKERRAQEALDAFISNYKNYLPNTSSELVQQLQADTADIALYATTNVSTPYSYLSSFFGSGRNNLFKREQAPVTGITFVNGQLRITSTYNCCDDSTALSIKKLYRPLTAFWPAPLSASPLLGSIQYNMDLGRLFGFIKAAADRMGPLLKEIKRPGLDLDKLPQLFNGEIAIAIQAGQNGNGKKQPRLLAALKLQDAAAAVSFMNRMGSNKLRSTRSYRFDENAQYLLFDTDGRNGLAIKPAAAPAAPVKAPEGSWGYINLNLKAMMAALTKDSKKTGDSYKQLQQFLGNVQVLNTTGNGALTSSILIDMGSPKTNALYNLVQLISKAGGTRFPPLSSLAH